MMSRKHFNEIAKILKTHKASKPLINAMASFLRTQNPRFNSDRFIDASTNSDRRQNDKSKYEKESQQNLRNVG